MKGRGVRRSETTEKKKAENRGGNPGKSLGWKGGRDQFAFEAAFAFQVFCSFYISVFSSLIYSIRFDYGEIFKWYCVQLNVVDWTVFSMLRFFRES